MPVWPLQRDCPSFYGNPADPKWYGANVVPVECPWPLKFGTTPVAHIMIHKLCAESLERVLGATWDACNKNVERVRAFRYDRFSGSFNFRKMRGGSALSMHSYACAIDFDAEDNAFHSTHHLFTDASPLVVSFKEEGWIWGGDWNPGSQDAMHVQAARIHA